MESVILLNKPQGISPLDAIKLFQQKNPEYRNIKLGVAGRLDPMAEGLLVVLVGEENKKRKDYERQQKEYTFEVLFGFETDSYDVLGKLVKTNTAYSVEHIKDTIKDFMKTKIGKFSQEYPPFSSPRVHGKPLFWWARNRKLGEIKIPQKEVEIFVFQMNRFKIIDHDSLINSITNSILSVKGVFRQEEILKTWIEFFKKDASADYLVGEFSILCSSGTYIRALSHELGQFLGTGALARRIIRTKVGNYTLKDSMSI